MFIYLLIYIPFILCAYFDFVETSSKEKNKILWFWVIVFTLFRGLRWEIGTDWEQFYTVYLHSDWNNIFNYARDNWSDKVMDYGYMFINTLFHKLGLSYTVFLLVTNFWIMWCYKDFSERHTKYPILTLILTMNVGVPFPVRQTIALATSLWGYRFAVEKQWVKYFIVAIIAALIHKGSLIGLIIILVPYVVETRQIKWWWYALAYVSTYVIAETLREYISTAIMWIASSEEQLETYGTSYMQLDTTSVDFGNYNVSMMNGLSYTLFFALLLWVREKCHLLCNTKIKHFETFFFMYVVTAIIDNLVRQVDATGITEILGRVTSTIDVFPLIFPLVFTLLLSKLLKDKNLICFIFCIYMSYKFWQQIPGSFYNFVFIPYKSIFYL